MSGRRLRSASILLGLGLAAAALVSWSQSWYAVTLTGLFEGHPVLEVTGDVAAPAVAALALASAAGFAAIAISGGFFRVVLALLELALGASIAASAILALASPVSAVSPAVTDVTGLEGAGALEQLVGSVTATAWPFVAVCAGALLSLLGIWIVATGRSWPRSGRRYESVRFESAGSAEVSAADASVSDWDVLSDGSDPTSG